MTGNTRNSTLAIQRRFLQQPSAAVAPNVNPPSHAPVFTWNQIERIQSINKGQQGNYDYRSHDVPGGQ